jgi:tricorn protease
MKYLILSLLLVLGMHTLSADEARILRYPNASKTHVTFTHGADIYVAPIAGGLARRVTSSEGREWTPRFSPDGMTIAFSAEYDGNREIYTIPSMGGTAKRVTYSMDIPGASERMGPSKLIMQWANGGKDILFRSREESWNLMVGNLFLINENGGMTRDMGVPRAGFASFSPDEKKMAYNRIFREFRTWKRYRGGQADDIWIYDFKSKSLENVTNNPAQDIIPIWMGNKIFYVSDRDFTANLFVYDLKTKQTRKVTDFKKYDVKFPSKGSGGIAFENGGLLYVLNPETEKYVQVKIEIAEDFAEARSKIVKVGKKITNYEIGRDGKRALFGARGDIFTVPAKKGKTRNLTNTNGIHERSSVWSPDGKWIAFISDETGEDEIYLMKPDGTKKTQLTDNAESYRFELRWSPDSKKLLSSDKSMKLYIIDVESKKRTDIVRSRYWEIRDYKWSPDSKWVAYSEATENEMTGVYLYSLDKEESYLVSDEFYNAQRPEFAADGKYLFFVSGRSFNPTLGNFELSYVYNDINKIYGVTLQDTLSSPFAFVSDEVEVVEDKKDKKKSKKDKKDKEENTDIIVDVENIKSRAFELPLPAGNYWHMTSVGNKLYYGKGIRGSKSGIFVYDFDKKEEEKVGSFTGYEISADGKKILFKQGGDYYISNLKTNIKPGKGKLDLSNMKKDLDHRQEWAQVFWEVWRQMHYFFYDPEMHGYDWKAIGDKYAEMLPNVVHRDDLTYILSEMISELNIGHAYVGGGEMPSVDKVSIGMLGVDFEDEKENGFFKIKKIYNGKTWDKKTRSPFEELGLDVREGDYIIEIDGVSMKDLTNPYEALIDKSGKFVNIKVNRKASDKDAKSYEVKTIRSEKNLRYYDWVETNRKKVEEATDGRIGYVHIPNMMQEGLNEFVKYFYPQIRKEGLIIDDRYNGGGFVSPMIIERLRRELAMVTHARNMQEMTTKPNAVFTGPMVCLVNEISASDGDIFPYQFKLYKLGTVIGKRTWGGIIGIRGSLPIVDGGYLLKPEFGNMGANGEWVVEGVGVSPDIEVDNDPAKEYAGEDEQLNKAIEVVLEDIKTNKKTQIPELPPFPNKNK